MLPLLLLLAAADLPTAELETLQGVRHAGQVRQVDVQGVKLQTDQGEVAVPLVDLMELRITGGTEASKEPAPISARLADGSLLGGTAVTSKGKTLSLESARLGTLKIPLTGVAQLRLQPLEAKFEEAWKEVLAKESKKDLLVLNKGEVLDSISGVIGDVDAESVKFLLDGDEVSVKRTRVFGLIYNRTAAPQKPVCTIKLAGGDQLKARSVSFDGKDWKTRLAIGVDVPLPAAELASLDFSTGSVQYLSSLDPRDEEYVPFLRPKNWSKRAWKTELTKPDNVGLSVWTYLRDRTPDNRKLKVGGREYARGLWLHSYTSLNYRIAGEFRRFQATVGIDDEAKRVKSAHARVKLTIEVDGKPAVQQEVKLGDPPLLVDLDVTNARDLRIEVDFAEPPTELTPFGFLFNKDTCDWLDLADARLLK